VGEAVRCPRSAGRCEVTGYDPLLGWRKATADHDPQDMPRSVFPSAAGEATKSLFDEETPAVTAHPPDRGHPVSTCEWCGHENCKYVCDEDTGVTEEFCCGCHPCDGAACDGACGR
jgi:hypothetical protein